MKHFKQKEKRKHSIKRQMIAVFAGMVICLLAILLVVNVKFCPSTVSVAVTSTLLFVHVFGTDANFISFESIFGTRLVFISYSLEIFFFPFVFIATASITYVVSCFNFVYLNVFRSVVPAHASSQESCQYSQTQCEAPVHNPGG